MKVTRREKYAIGLLVIIVSLFGYHRFILTPQLAELEAIKDKSIIYEKKMKEFNKIDILESSLVKEISELQQMHQIVSSRFFPNSLQEELIILLKDFADKAELQISSVNFSSDIIEVFEEDSIDIINANITIEGSYDAFTKFLNSIWNFQRKIILKSFNISNTEDEMITGSIILEFYGLPDTEVEERLYDWNLKPNHRERNPFKYSKISKEINNTNYIYAAGNSLLLIEEKYQPFVDIENHWAKKEIDAFGQMYYIRGDKNNYYYPDESMTRGEFFLLLDRVFQWEEPEERIDLTSFDDYEKIGTYEDAIAKAIYKGHYSGYIVGYTDNTLRPEVFITYEEVEMVMRKALDNPEFKWKDIGEEIYSQKGIRSKGIEATDQHLTKAEGIYFLYHL